MLVQNRLHVHCFEEVFVPWGVGELQPLEDSKDLLIVLESFEIVIFGVYFIGILFKLIEVEEQSGKWLRSELFQVSRVEKSVLQAGRQVIHELA